MSIYGTALLAACYLVGVMIGDCLGVLTGTKTNIGGVGIAMILLIVARIILHKKKLMQPESEGAVRFWAAMYIPVVIAMAATQNVVVALKGGAIALLAAVGSVVLCALTIAVINRIHTEGTGSDPNSSSIAQE